MAQKRMFTMKIVDSDAFLDMPLSSQCLYFHLNMRADDDGFVGNPKKIMRMIGASDDDMKLLILKKFILIFENNIVVIKHWWIHNTLIKDRYHETTYIDEKNQLKIKDNHAYSLDDGTPINVNEMLTDCTTNCKQDVNRNLDLNLGLNLDLNLDKDNTPKTKKITEPKKAYGEYQNVFLSDTEYNDLISVYGENQIKAIIEKMSCGIMAKGYKYKNYKAAIKNWLKNDFNTNNNSGSAKGLAKCDQFEAGNDIVEF